LRSRQVRSLLATDDGVLWIGTQNGLERWDPKAARMLPALPGFPESTLMAMHQDARGRVWLGASTELVRVDGDRLVRFDAAQPNPGEAFFGFSEDSDGTLWIASDAGLVRWREGGFRVLGRAQGLPFYSVLSIVRDGNGDFWLGSDGGVLRLPAGEVSDVLDRDAHSGGGRLFGRDDGMPSSQCNGGSSPAAIRTREGELWFATARGVAIADPKIMLDIAPEPPGVLIGRLVVNDQDMPLDRELALGPGRHSLLVQFAATALTRQGQLEHFYRVVGFDDDWETLGSERSLRLTNLPPGEFRLEIAARFGQGALSAQPARLSFSIAPYVWQRAWFLPSLAALVLGLIMLAVAWRTRALQARSTQLRALVAEKTEALAQEMRRLAASDAEKSELLRLLGSKSMELQRLAREDALTGLSNRRHFDERLREAFAQAASLAVLLCDLDHFKQINDAHSHRVGDLVLQAFAAQLRAEFGDGVIARYGGEEFAVLLPAVDLASARARAEALRARTAAHDWSGIAEGLHATVSIGVAVRESESVPDRLVAAADRRLYEAKQLGRNRVV
jgi:diguanylate cyclase (GGDEF)-like protein